MLYDVSRLLEKYPNKRFITIKYASVGNNSYAGSGTLLNDPNSMQTAFEGYAKLIDAPYSPGDNAIKLLCLSDYKQFTGNRPAILVKSNFYSIYVKSAGGAGFTANQVNTVIDDSLTSPNYAYNMAGQRFTNFAGHQPNFFNPKIVINQNYNVYNGLDLSSPSYDGTTNNVAMQGIGLHLPHEHYPVTHIENVDSIDVFAQHLQIIQMGNVAYYQMYPVICELLLLVL